MQLLLASVNDLKNTYKKYLVFEFAYLVLTGFLFVPLIAYIFNRILIAMGASSLSNNNLLKIGLSYEGALGLLVISFLAVTIIFIELGVLIVIAHKTYFRKNISIIAALITNLKRLKKICSFGVLQLMFFLLFLIPFLELPVAATLINTVPVPVFMMNKIFNSLLFTSMYIIALMTTMYLFTRGIFTLHFIVIDGMPIREAIKASLQLTKRNTSGIIISLVLFNLLVSACGLLIISGISFIPVVLEISAAGYFMSNYLLTNYLLTLSSMLAFIFALLLTPINIIFVTRLFYQRKISQGIELEDNLTTPINTNYEAIEGQAFSFFRKRKQLLIFVAVVNLGATFYFSYYITDDLINLGRRVQIAGHRGDLHSAPENTLSSIRSAIEKEVDFVEIDVQMTKDGAVVLNHDRNLKRMADIPQDVATLTYQELAEIDVGQFFYPKFQGERIPTLAQVFKEVGGQTKFIVDIKPYGGTSRDLATAVVELIDSHNMLEDAYIQAFDYEILAEVRRINPDIKIGQILFLTAGDLLALDVDFYTIEQGMLTNSFIRQARQHEREVWVWTVNREQDIRKVLQYDIDGIITDYPERVKKQLELNL